MDDTHGSQCPSIAAGSSKHDGLDLRTCLGLQGNNCGQLSGWGAWAGRPLQSQVADPGADQLPPEPARPRRLLFPLRAIQRCGQGVLQLHQQPLTSVMTVSNGCAGCKKLEPKGPRARRDSNAQSSAPEADALSIRPRAQRRLIVQRMNIVKSCIYVVGTPSRTILPGLTNQATTYHQHEHIRILAAR